ncbi:MAG: CRISPR system precrRNA processing endoribonuclease RAMP protein Cas6 [Nitrospirota bacterium]|nr:CRISPR system precrRNA processing endoribonuclease RAMP protein Cas6 [Nitrospirota bacterium]
MNQQSTTQPGTSYLKQTLSGFRALKVEFTLFPLEKIHLGPDEVKGDRWRGGFGEALRNLACLCRWDKTACDECDMCAGCLYYRYFFTDRPLPYVMLPRLDGKKGYETGERLQLDMVLIGEAAGHVDKFIMTVEEMGRAGIGSRRGRFRVKSVVAEDSIDASAFFEEEAMTVDQCSIELLTPLKIREGISGLNYCNLSFETFFRLLIKRIINLNNLYCNGKGFDKERIEPEKQDLFTLAGKIETKAYTEWRDFNRFSSRQHKSLKIGGQLGIIRYNGEIGRFYPFLKLGEVLGVGQHTTSGFGRYRLMPPEKYEYKVKV